LDATTLIAELHSPDVRPYRKQEVIRELTTLHLPESAPAIAALLHSNDRYLQREAVKALTVLPCPEATRDLVSILDSSDYSVREYAARALALSGDHTALGKLAELENDVFSSVRNAAAEAIEAIRSRPKPAESEPTQATGSDAPAADTVSTDAPSPTETTPPVEQLPQAAAPDTSKPEEVPEPQSHRFDSAPYADCFGDQAELIGQLRKQLHERRTQRPQLHQEREALARKLRLEHADKDDDVAAAKVAVKAADKLVKGHSYKRAEALASHAELTQKREKWLHRTVATLLFRDDDEEARLAELDREAERLASALDEARDELASAKETYNALRDPLLALQRDTREAAEAVQENNRAITATVGALHERVVAALTDAATAAARRQALLSRTDESQHLTIALHELDHALEALATLDRAIDDNESRISKARACARETTDQLGAATAGAFHIVQVNRKTTAALSGSVRFTGGASGSASGSGSGSASYVLDQPEWQPTDSFTEALETNVNQWQALGAGVNDRHRLMLQRDACQRSLAEFAEFILAQLPDEHGE
jgi:hypothetical protein